MAAIPVWVWLPGAVEPVQAGELSPAPPAHFVYLPDYLDRADAVALDPVELRLLRRKRGSFISATDGLPGVLRDAKPAGYGADRLNAQAGRVLSPLELLERGVPDGVGAIEACQNIEAKLAWRPQTLAALQPLAEALDEHAPASAALRRLNQDVGTSAGGERPKLSLEHAGRLWLAKMQDRGDRVAMPAREFTTMRLAHLAGLNVAPVELHTLGRHQVLLVERFDRAGDPLRLQRRLFASAHTVLRLPLAATPGDARRSYLHLADCLRIWARGQSSLPAQLRELWQRMAFNALVGNVDDHPLNHGFLHEGGPEGGWQLAPAFDITPALFVAPVAQNPAHNPTHTPVLARPPALAMATGVDGGSLASAQRLLAAAPHFGLAPELAQAWLSETARLVASHWADLLREAARPVLAPGAALEALVADARAAFAYAETLAETA